MHPHFQRVETVDTREEFMQNETFRRDIFIVQSSVLKNKIK